MSEVVFALLEAGVVGNVIVVEAGDDPFPTDYVADDGNPYDLAVRVDQLSPRPGIGWIRTAGGQFLEPANLSVDRSEIPPNGTTAATVTYTDHRTDPPPAVDFVVNGETHSVPLAGGVASLPVASSTPGDVINVAVEGMTASITVTGP